MRALLGLLAMAACAPTTTVPRAEARERTGSLTFISYIMIEGDPPNVPVVTGRLATLAKRGAYLLVYPPADVVYDGDVVGAPVLTILADEAVTFATLAPMLDGHERVDLVVRRANGEYAVIPVAPPAAGRTNLAVDGKTTWRELSAALEAARASADDVSVSLK